MQNIRPKYPPISIAKYWSGLEKEIAMKKRADKSIKIRKHGKRTSWRGRKHW